MLNLMNRIKLPLAAVLFTCVVLLSSAAAFASEGEFPSPSEVSSDFTLVIPEQYEDPVYDKLASGDVRALHDVNDVYLLLYDDVRPALLGSYQNSNFSLPRIAYDLRWFKTHTMTANDSSIFEDQFDVIYDNLPAIYGSVSQIHGDGQNMTYYLSQINSNLSSLANISDINWISSNSSYLGTSLTYSSSFLNNNTVSKYFTCKFNFASDLYNTLPGVLRVYLPFSHYNYSFDSSDYELTDIRISSSYVPGTIPDYFIEPAYNGIYLYLFQYEPMLNYYYYFRVDSSSDMTFWSNTSGSVSYIPFDTYDYQVLKDAFYNYKTANSIGSVSDSVKSLADYFVSPEKQAAENASQAVIDDTLDGFTGNGSAAAKTSDTGSMKNMSSSLQSGLDTGASAGTAASVFTDYRYWGWFTQQNADLINNPYPAPTYQSTRAPGDQIRDAYSHNQSDLEDILRGSSW